MSQTDRAQPQPAEPIAGMTPQQLAEAKQYGRMSLYCDLADKALDIALLLVLALVFARSFDSWLKALVSSDSARLVLLYLAIAALQVVVSFPLSFYEGFVLEHRFGLSRLSFGRWLLRYVKATGLAVGFTSPLLLGMYWIIWLTGPLWWLVAAGAFFVVSIVIGQLMPVLILPLFYKVQRLERADLTQRMSRLAADAGLAIEGVYQFDMSSETVKANAMLAGLGRTRRVILGDTLLENFTPEEIEVVFAHEVGHHVHRHIRKMIVTGLFFSAAGFWLCDRILVSWVTHVEGRFSYSDFPVYTLPLLMLLLMAFGLLLAPLQNAISRYYERQCDRYALEHTGLKQAYISAFSKLAKLNKGDPSPHPLEVFLFHGHPPMEQRIAMGQQCRLES